MVWFMVKDRKGDGMVYDVVYNVVYNKREERKQRGRE